MAELVEPQFYGTLEAYGNFSASIANAHSRLGAQIGDIILFFTMAGTSSTGVTVTVPGTIYTQQTQRPYTRVSYVVVTDDSDPTYTATISVNYPVGMYAVRIRGYTLGPAGAQALGGSVATASLSVSGFSDPGRNGLAVLFGGCPSANTAVTPSGGYSVLRPSGNQPAIVLATTEYNETIPGSVLSYSPSRGYRSGVIIALRRPQ